jgi:hypothetical protein
MERHLRSSSGVCAHASITAATPAFCSAAVRRDLEGAGRREQPAAAGPPRAGERNASGIRFRLSQPRIDAGSKWAWVPPSGPLSLTARRRPAPLSLGRPGLADHQPRGLLHEPRLLRRQQRPVHIAARASRLGGHIALLPCPGEPRRQVVPGLALEGVRVRKEEIAHGGTLLRRADRRAFSRRRATLAP